MRKEAKEKIKKLVERYKKLSEKEIKKDYNEERTKNVFIQPLFEALGWDFQDDVWPEKEAVQGRADYAFMLGGLTKFFVEAKPLRVDLDIETHAKQAINYSWNKGVTWAVLTDFEGIKIFNAQAQSKLLIDKLIFEIPYSEYISDFDRLWLLSKESFEKNALDQYAIKHGKKIKKLTVNEKLYSDLKKAREILTESFKTWNENVDKETLDEGVQRILDRLVFIRVLEDRGLEDATLKPMIREWEAGGKKEQLFQLMIKKFRELDDIYNSSLFREHACERWEEYDDKIITAINMLYGSNVYEYDFSKIPADILGGVYESYLGYIAQNPIEIDKAGKSGKLLKTEGKKEIKTKSRKKRKEQGIYYTPKFIVDYIVQNTLGKKLEEVKNMHELKKIKVLDPACGSGSFLTKALQTINDKYIDFNNPGKQETKSEILMSNIYGVDLDPQAIELAKLNLLIEALDKKAKLPDLTGNVRVGNSLISRSEKELKKYFGKDWRDKKAFNWEEEFSFCHSLEKGNPGFDVVIGNPPWGANIDEELKYLGDKYPDSTQAHKDIYKIFIDKSISLLKLSGLLGFIVPNTFLYQPRYKDIRKVINQYENFVINLGERIFSNVQLPACILILKNKKGKNKFVADLTQDDRASLSTKIFLIDSKKEQQINDFKKSIIKDTELKFDDVFLLKDAGVQYASTGAGKAGKGKSD
ncbi:MAG: N-6 DNA methylase, partial [Patescibacteria group bacterium]|nr:N-6 DNA methylase [Patescibacteria group bacterium]